MNKLLVLVVGLGIACGASSCNVWRRVRGKGKKAATAAVPVILPRPDTVAVASDTARTSGDTIVVAAPPVADSLSRALLAAWLPRWNMHTDYTTFSGKAAVSYSGEGESRDFTAAIRMEKDKRIWMAITGSFLGMSMEAARVLITPDTVFLLDRLHREVRILPFAEAGSLLPIPADFSTIQRLIIGDVLSVGHQPLTAADSAGTVSLLATGPGAMQYVQFATQDSAINLQWLTTQSSAVSIEYRDYALIGDRRFANGRNLVMHDSGLHNMVMDFSSAAFNEPVDMSFSIPAKYDRK